MSDNVRDVHLSSDLCRMAEQKYANRFSTVEQLLTYLMEQLVRDDATKMDQEEQRIIEQRLKDLGYI